MKINYFGEPYSFSHIVALRRFGKNNHYIPRSTIEDTIKASMSEPQSLAVVPIENSIRGIVINTVDILCSKDYITSPLTIIDELEMQISLFLLSKKEIELYQIKIVYSHEFPLKISEPWIKKHLPLSLDKICVTSTSEAVVYSKKDKHSCAIASSEAAKYYNLRKIKKINVKGKRNITKFFVIKNEKVI